MVVEDCQVFLTVIALISDILLLINGQKHKIEEENEKQ